MGFLLALTAVASIATGVSAQCVPLIDAAMEAGLTGVLDAVGLTAGIEAAAPLLEIATANETLDAPITLFAPTNEAFAEVASTVASLEPELILAVILNHVLPTAEDAATLVATAPAVLPTVLGTDLSTALVGEDLSVASGLITGTVVVADVMTCAGIVHVIDKVLVPVIETNGAPMAAPGPGGDRGIGMAPSPAGSYGSYGNAV